VGSGTEAVRVGDSGERRPRSRHAGPSEQPHPHAGRGRRRRSSRPHAEPPAGPFRHRLRRVGHPLRRGDREHPPRRDPARDSFRLLVESGASDRVLRDGHEHRGSARGLVEDRHQYFREYPYAWFGVLVQAPASAPELIYAKSPYGFALISQRTSDIQRLYFQCDPTDDPRSWSDDRIWEQLQLRLAGEDGFRLNEGPVIERTVLPFRSFVQTPLRHRRLLLAGDAGHTVPPTGAKGLNLPWPTYVLWRR